MGDLFREEVIRHRRQRLAGDVFIARDRSSSLLIGLIIMVAVTMSAAAWTGQYARTEIASGSVVTSRPLTKIVAARPGVITNVHVMEGQDVLPNQSLVTISVDTSLDGATASGASSISSLERQMVLAAQQKMMIIETARQEQARLMTQLDGLEEEADRLRAQHTLQVEIIESSHQMLTRIEEIAARGFISRFELERRQQELLQKRQFLEQIGQQIATNTARAADLEAQSGRVTTSREQQLGEQDAASETIAQQLYSTRSQSSYVVTAPVGGTVSGLTFVKGRMVDSTRPILSLLPSHTVFEAEVYAPSRAIGFIRPGQKVRLMYEAYPYRKFGSFGGTVASVGRVAIAPSESDSMVPLAEPTYRVRVKLAEQSVLANGRRQPLQPGMVLTANIILERRSFLDWLLEPVRAVRNRL